MAKNQMKIVIEGMPEDDGLVRAKPFIHELHSITQAVSTTDTMISGKTIPSFYLRIIELSYKSPATVVLEAVPDDPDIDLREKAIDKFWGAYQAVWEGALTKREIEYALIEDMLRITNPIGKSVRSVTIEVNGHDLHITQEFKAKIDFALAPEERVHGFIRGMLEYINIHKGQNVFRIYPDVGPAKVACHFREELRSRAIEGIGKYVEVRGELNFKAVSSYPHEIMVEEIEIFLPEEELSSLFKLRGIAQNLTGNLSSERFVRKVRDAQVS